MGTLRTIAAWLGISTVGLVSGLPHVTLADDAGPGREVRAIRHDLPLIVSARLQALGSKGFGPIQVTDVVTNGSAALSAWQQGGVPEIDLLEKLYGKWWLAKEVYFEPSGSAIGSGGFYTPIDGNGATSLLLQFLNVPAPLITLAATHVSLVRDADARDQAHGPRNSHGDGYEIDSLNFSNAEQMPSTLGVYEMSVRFATNDGPSAKVVDVSGRAPTEAESWETYGGNSYFFFSGTVDSTAPVHVQAGTTIDVWFPFVLDPSLYYGLTIAHADKPIGPIDGTLKDNVVHFVLPAFTLPPGATLMGEIEGDSFRHE